MHRFILLIIISCLGLTSISPAQQVFDFNMQQAQEAYQAGDYSKAVTYLEQILKKDSLRLGAHTLLGSSYLALQQPILAENSADEGLRHFPNSRALQWIKAEAILQQNRLNQALPLYLALYEKGNFSNDVINRDELEQRLGLIYQSQGARAFQQKKLDKAEKKFQKARQFMPDSLHSYNNLALVYLQQEKWQEALSTISQGLVKFPGNDDLLRMRANALYQTEDYDGVVEQYHELYEQNPNDTETAIQYARLLMAKGEQDEAYSIYDRLLTENPKNKDVYESLLEIYEQRNDLIAKRSLLYKMRRQFPDETSLLGKIAETYELEEEWDLARETYDSLRTSTDDSSVELAIARTWEQQDSLLKALEVYRGAVEEYPDDADLLHHKGITEETLGKYQEALKTYQDLFNIQGNRENHIHLGRVNEEVGNTKKALEHYLAAIDLGTDEPSPHFGAARIVISDNQDRAFNLTKDALEHALTKVEVEQQQLANKLNEQDNLFGINATDDYGKQLEEYDQLAEDIFMFMTRNFEQERILPFLSELESKYPNSGRLLYLQSTYYGEINNTEKQFELLKQAVELQPGLVEPHLALGDYYIDQGHRIKAIGSFERALSIAPEEAKPYKMLIDLYRDTEQLDQLIDRWKARYRARPKNEVLREHLIEALHKASRYGEAREVIDNDF